MAESKHGDVNRRDFLYIATAVTGAVAAGSFIWPAIDQMNASADVRALSSIKVKISDIEPGQQLVVKWLGKPIFIRRRTAEEVAAARAVELEQLKDPIARNENLADVNAPASDEERSYGENGEWLIAVGVCTHLGCVPVLNEGDYDGWYCPCHGSHYDVSGRIRKGPARTNLPVPPLEFLPDGETIQIG